MRDLAMHIMDIMQNSIDAGATKLELNISESAKSNSYILVLEDNGSGMNSHEITACVDPFYTTKTSKKVGLGIALLKQNAELAAGKFKIESRKNNGTKISAFFKYNHIDRLPLGDVSGVLKLIMHTASQIKLIYIHTTDEGEYIFSSDEIKESLGEDVFKSSQMLNAIKEMINENLYEIKVEI